jgi:hypothetical protein
VQENLLEMAAAGGPGPIMNSWSSTLNVTARGQLLLIQLLPARPAAGRSDGAAPCVSIPSAWRSYDGDIGCELMTTCFSSSQPALRPPPAGAAQTHSFRVAKDKAGCTALLLCTSHENKHYAPGYGFFPSDSESYRPGLRTPQHRFALPRLASIARP